MDDMGKTFRFGRLLKHGKLLCVPLDHGVTHGGIGHLRDIEHSIGSVSTGGGSAIVLHKGLAARFVVPPILGLLIHVSAGTNLSSDPNRKSVVTSVERALALGADGISIHVNFGSPYEHEMLRDLGVVAEECSRFSIPLMAMTYIRPNAFEEIKDPVKIAHAARVVAELGADIAKVSYPGSAEGVNAVVSTCPVPVVIAGGECKPVEDEALTMAEESMRGGALGISYGRNVFERTDMTAIVRKLGCIVYDGMTAADVMAGVDTTSKGCDETGRIAGRAARR